MNQVKAFKYFLFMKIEKLSKNLLIIKNDVQCFCWRERLNSQNYLLEHLTIGPVSEIHHDGHLRCRKTLMRWAHKIELVIVNGFVDLFVADL